MSDAGYQDAPAMALAAPEDAATVAKLVLSFKGRPLKVYLLGEDELAIGSDPACDIHIDSLAVAPHHARVAPRDAAHVLQVEGGEVRVNERPVTEHTLQPGDTIQIGKHTLSYSREYAPEVAPRAQASSTPVQRTGWLQILRGANVGRTVRLDRALLRIGKPGGHCALVSRREDGYFLSHLEGSDRPCVAGASIGEQSRRLEDGDVFEIGEMQLQFFLEGSD
jgi:predicted component of type VI protein secretion system